MKQEIIILWFRNDLRLADNLALQAAIDLGQPILPIYIYDDIGGEWSIGAASKIWLYHALSSLNSSLESKLYIRSGDALHILSEICKNFTVSHIFWNRLYEPFSIQRDSKIKTYFKGQNIQVESFNSSLLFEPWQIQNKQGLPHKVFSYFWKTCLAAPAPYTPIVAPKNINIICKPNDHETLDMLNLCPVELNWDQSIIEEWDFSEAAAYEQWSGFLDDTINQYDEGRDIPGKSLTSKLSPYLHFGQISPRQIWADINALPAQNANHARYLSEIGWREFSYHLLYHFPYIADKPIREEFARFPWLEKNSEIYRERLQAWQKGQTGYPIIDAGMRQLWATGWMHNRVRMVVASFLIKHLLIHWKEGEKWFWDCLVDADLASNAASWQWVAGSGFDASPYFRIFNPMTQGKKFDPDGEYIRKWVPELSNIPNKYIHTPWEASDLVLRESGVVLGEVYPYPIVDHKTQRQEALDGYQSMRKG